MGENMRAALRNLQVRAVMTFATGIVRALSGAEILRFTLEEGADSALLPGAVLSANYRLELANDSGQWLPGGALRGNHPLMGATVELFLQAGMDVEQACGTFIVSEVQADEHSGRISLVGSDSITTELAGTFVDSLSYPTTLGGLWNHLLAQTRYAAVTLPNASEVVATKPAWKDASLRQVAGWIAMVAGCFLRVSRAGALEVVPCIGNTAVALGPEEYLSLRQGFQSYGPVEAVRVVPVSGDAFTVKADSFNGTGEMVSVSGNPLLTLETQRLVEAMLARIAGMRLNRTQFRWRGDPDVSIGARIVLTDTSGAETECTITRQTLRFSNGFSADCICEIPRNSASGVLRAITPEGGLNANALMGTVDGGLLAAGSVTASAIAAQSITAEKIAAGAITTEKLQAGAVTAEKLDVNAVNAQTITALTAQLKEIVADKIVTDELYVALADIVALMVGQINAGTIATDQLAVVLGEVVALYADYAGLDFADIKDLIADEVIIRAGTAGELYIDRLAATSALLVSATLGELVLRGEDGLYYTVTVQSDGTIATTQVIVTEEEIAAGQTDAGRTIVSTSADIAALHAQSIKGTSAQISEIFTQALTAGSITAGQALIASATVPELYVTAIEAIGNGIDITAHTAIRLLIESNEQLQAWLRFDADGMNIGKAGSAYITRTDDTGFHVLQKNEEIGSFSRRALEVENVRVGPLAARTPRAVLRQASGGGMVLVMEG